MNVLFVASGNSKNFTVAPFIKAQGEALLKRNIQIDYFLITEKGIKGYLTSIPKLRKQLKQKNYNLVHAHYALSGWVAILSLTKKPIVVSYMGCDTYGDFDKHGHLKLIGLINIILGKLLQPFCNAIIVKSKNLEKYIYLKKRLFVIPNGVDLKTFYYVEKQFARRQLKYELDNKYVLFLADPLNMRKNIELLNQLIHKICYCK